MIQGTIKQGTTPTHIFEIPLLPMLSAVRVNYFQNKQSVFVKELDDLTVDVETNEVSCKLTQQETLSLDTAYNVEIEIKYKTQGGDVFMTEDPIELEVEGCLCKKEI